MLFPGALQSNGPATSEEAPAEVWIVGNNLGKNSVAVRIETNRHIQVTFRRGKRGLDDGSDVSVCQRDERHTCSVSFGFSQNAFPKAGSLLGHKCSTEANNAPLEDFEKNTPQSVVFPKSPQRPLNSVFMPESPTATAKLL